MDTNTHEAAISQKPRGRRRGWLIVLLIVLLGAAWWGWGHRPYRVIGRYRIFSSCEKSFFGDDHGFMFREKDTTFVCRDWHGKVRWTLTTARPVYPPQQQALPAEMQWRQGYAAGLSSNGRFFAAAMVHGDGLRVQQWRDGKLQYDRVVQALGRLPRNLNMSLWDDGRLFLADYGTPDGERTPVCFLRDGRVQAKGTLPNRFVLCDNGRALITPYYDKFIYADLRMAQGKVTLQRRYTSTDPLTFFRDPDLAWTATVAKGDYILADNGAVYTAAGRKFMGSALPHDDEEPAGARFSLHRRDGTILVYDPRTNRHLWQVKVPGEYYNGQVAEDGRWALLNVRPEENSPLRKLLRRFKFTQPYVEKLPWMYLELHERPGRRRAQVCFDMEKVWGKGERPVDEGGYWLASQDCQDVVITYGGQLASGEHVYKAVLFHR